VTGTFILTVTAVTLLVLVFCSAAKAQLDIDAFNGELDMPRLRGGLAALHDDVTSDPLPSYPWRDWLEPQLAYIASVGPRTHTVPWADIRLRLLLERHEAEQFYALVTASYDTGELRALTVRPEVMAA